VNQNINNKFIERIESELLLTLFNYVIPFIDKKIKITKKEKNQKISNLENIVNNSKEKIRIEDIKKLEALLLKNLSNDVKVNKNVEITSNNIFYSLGFTKKKNENKANSYSISIKYEENRQTEKLSVSIKKSENEIYSAEIINKKETKDEILPYSIKIFYIDTYSKERLSIAYKQQLRNYLKQHLESKEDMTIRVPLKWLNVLPETMMGGILGFTYLGENFMARRADLTGKTARMVDIHESIHTPDEYETRILTDWIMSKANNKYFD